MKRICYNAGIPFVLLFFSAQVFAGNVTTTLTPSSGYRLRALAPDTVFAATVDVYSVINSGTEVQRSLIAYDLSSIPQNLPIYSATLTIHHKTTHYAGQAEGTSSEVYRITTPWASPTWNSSATKSLTPWATRGGDYSGIGGSATPYATNSDYVANDAEAFMDYDVTSLVSEWHAGTYDNYGLLMSGSTGNLLHFSDPVLTLSYDFDGNSNTTTLTSSSVSRLRALAPDTGYTDVLSVANSGTEVQHSLIAYDFSSIPTEATINSATLTVHHETTHYAGQAEGTSSEVYRVTTPWSSPTWNSSSSVILNEPAPWTTSGGDYIGTGGSGAPYAINSDYVAKKEDAFMDYDVTSLVSGWHAGTYDNYGLLMSGTDGNLLHFSDPVLTVTYGSTTLLGDADGDGTVDGSDLERLADNWLVMENATWGMGDFNSDGKVDDSDATILAANWQKTASAASVPEPSMAAMLLGCFAMLFCGISSFARHSTP